jgi:hypothetical protein
METMVYRKSEVNASPRSLPMNASAVTPNVDAAVAAQETPLFSPGYFYPVITEQEMVTWTHWLPTSIVFHRHRMYSPTEILRALSSLHAPGEVIEEFHWSWKLELFDTYEVRTPVRRDSRDPLLIGCVGGKQYRIVLWGESLLPLERITELVQQSLEIKARAITWRTWLLLSGTFIGFLFGTWVGASSLDGQPMSTAFLFALLGFFAVWLPTFLYTPENRQHNFLDRYRL